MTADSLRKTIQGPVLPVAKKVAALFSAYRLCALSCVAHHESLVNDELWDLMPELGERFALQRQAIATNDKFLRDMLTAFSLTADGRGSPEDDEANGPVTDGGTVHPLLIQLKREWAAEGKLERAQCFGAILAALKKYLPLSASAPARPIILVPGPGLGRLNWELTMHGYDTLGIEQAMSMFLCAQYVMKHLLPSANVVSFCPHAFEGRGPANVKHYKHLAREFTAPEPTAIAQAQVARTQQHVAAAPAAAQASEAEADEAGRQSAAAAEPVACASTEIDAVTASSASRGSNDDQYAPANFGISRMMPGDYSHFCRMPNEQNRWDAVVSCFYVDACGDPIAAAEATLAVLKPGGLWLVCGPLEYDGAGGLHHDENALRLCADEFVRYVERRGFQILEAREQRCDYTQDAQSMINTSFQALFLVARKATEEAVTGEAAAGEAGGAS